MALKGNHKSLIAWLWLPLALITGNLVMADEAIIAQGLSEYTAALEAKDRNVRLQTFARAEQLFQQAAEEQQQATGVVSTELLVNLGNAALQAEHLGPAILAYRRALLQQPSHSRARQNLQFARGLLPESVRFDQSTQLVDTLFFWRSLISRNQLELITSSLFLLAAAAFAVNLMWRESWWRIVALGLGMLWGVMLVSLAWDQNDPASVAVVVVDEAYVHSADSENSTLRFADPLPDGTEVRVLERRERWLEIEVAGRSGWINASHVAFLAP